MGGQRTPKWTGSKANSYIGRNKACKKLQISLSQFRRLCILKGIYPHDPKKKHRKEGDRKVYYHLKDIQALKREPILWKHREQKTFKNKIKRHKGRENWDKVKRMQLAVPTISMDHLVRERYPRFVNAIQDFDDCATLVHLFASLPSGIIPQLTAARRLDCQRLIKEFQHYISICGLLRKSFVSIKGIYYQAKILNKYNITWIVPHNFPLSKPDSVDWRVMSSFLDFYQTLFKFVNFKLYKLSNIKYPPFGDISFDDTNLSLTNLRNKSFKKIMNKDSKKQEKKSPQKEKLDITNLISSKGETTTGEKNESDLEEEDEEEKRKQDTKNLSKLKENKMGYCYATLFKNYKFLLNRETPQVSLEFIILSLGGEVLFEQELKSKIEYYDKNITHQIVDRKMNKNMLVNTRHYIQPQWIYDSLNVGAIIPVEHYQPGIQCPPHLSPFVDYDRHKHTPNQEFVLNKWKEISGLNQKGNLLNKNELSEKEAEFVEDEEEMKLKDKQNELEKELWKIGMEERDKKGNVGKEYNNISKEEKRKIDLAKTLMPKRFKKMYEKINRRKRIKNKYSLHLERKRNQIENEKVRNKWKK